MVAERVGSSRFVLTIHIFGRGGALEIEAGLSKPIDRVDRQSGPWPRGHRITDSLHGQSLRLPGSAVDRGEACPGSAAFVREPSHRPR
jgi:hypothetical protein